MTTTVTATPKTVTRGELTPTTPRAPEKAPATTSARPSLLNALLRALSAFAV